MRGGAPTTMLLAGLACGLPAFALTAAEPPAPAAAKPECHLFAVTWDGGSKEHALERAQSGLDMVIAKWRAEQDKKSGWAADTVTVEAFEAEPDPYWRFRVKPHLFMKPDVVTPRAHLVCWEGVISKAVCTAGAKVCK